MQTTSFPKLSRLALRTFCIAASSASAERTFSVAGQIVTEKRSRIKPDAVDATLRVRDYYHEKLQLDRENTCP